MQYLRTLGLVLIAACTPEVNEGVVSVSALALSEDRSILPAPSPPDAGAFAPVPDPIPTLLFHNLSDSCDPADIYCTTRENFYSIVLMLKSAGYQTISSRQYADFRTLNWTGLPSKPVLITFDDGHVAAYRAADDILRTTCTRATMFVITGNVDNPAYMNWSEIKAANASGHWDIELHGHNSHVKVNDHPWLAWRFEGESYDAWKARAEDDIWTGIKLLHANLPNYAQRLYAVPYGNYGQLNTNDPAIPVELSWFFNQRFGAWFTQADSAPDFGLTTPRAKERKRYTVKNTATADTVYAWLVYRAQARARTPSL